ncbi:hypothetical protein ACS0TY_017033 [Phlomoides rotata]
MAQFLLTSILCALILSINLLRLSFGIGLDTLLPNQKISIGQTLISPNQDFEMGFFSSGGSPNRFLGIWYKNTPDVVVWVANRNNFISDSNGVTFSITGKGTLVISRNGSIIWSANPSGAASNPVLLLLDTGNLVLVNETMEQGSSNSYIWQSFDYPTDTALPGMKIENQGLPDLVLYRGNTKMYRIGKWNGLYFGGYPRYPNEISKPELLIRGETLISIKEVAHDRPILSRSTVDTSGIVYSYTMNARKYKWNRVYSSPRDQCNEYGLCGPNGVCSSDKPIQCQCFTGFAPKFPKEWNLEDWSGGCTRITPLNCNSGDGFQEVRGVKYPDMLEFWLNTSMSLDECQAECLKNCSCSTAYANPYITNGGSGCIMWFGDLIDTRHLPGEDTKQNAYIRLPVSELVDYSSLVLEKKKKRPTSLIFISIATGFIVSGFINGGIFMMRRSKKQAFEKNNEDLDLPLLKFATIVAATNNFSKENMIGEGGFGPVYKGILPSEEEIAIKRLSTTSGQGVEEFKNKAILIAKLQHTNLVRLLGCCIEGEERMLIYEYLQNKSLDYFVFDQNRRKLLTWPNRFNIVMGIARGLLYLHHDSRLRIIHRDLKTSNILLDENLKPKISDFGLARTFVEDQLVTKTRRVIGTYDYMAPEYAIAGKYSVKSNVFSMGVVLLEIVSGKKNRGLECNGDHFHSLLGHTWLLWEENKILELMDECLKDTIVESEVKRCIHVGLLCVQKFVEDRPEMSSALFMLGMDGAILPEPGEPGFFVESSSNPVRNSTSPGMMSVGNSITITDLEAR